MNMNNSIPNIEQFINMIWEKRDKRMDNWPLLDSVLPTLILPLLYVVLTVFLGPLLMEKRKPYNIKTLMIIYNGIMVAVNFYMVQQIWVLGWAKNYNVLCTPLDRSINPTTAKVATIYYMYYIVKYLDWIDSCFFILRKKFTHLNTLHVYHHFATPTVAWINARFFPGGQSSSLILLNGGVHVIMHIYYATAALGPEYQKYLWWKKYLTMLQIVQLALLALHAILPFFQPGCHLGYSFNLVYYNIFTVITILLLFIKFYIESYISKSKDCKKIA